MQWPHPVEAEMHITAELNRSGVDYRNSGQKNFKLNCPFPHSEKGADDGFHLEITKDGRKAHCWVCDWSGSWNKLAKAMGLTEFNSTIYADTYNPKLAESDVFKKIADDLELLSHEEAEDALPTPLTPWGQPVWRGLNKKFLKRFPAHLWKQKVRTRSGKTFIVDRILFPYMQYDRLVGWVGRRLDKMDFQKYYRAPWSSAKKILFPFDYVRSYHAEDQAVVLVEGEVDALNLLQAGIPALSILGSNNWSEDKVDLLLSTNFKHVYLLMDPDPAGRSAEKKIKPTLSAKFDSVHTLRIDGNDDPGSLDQDQLAWLKARVLPVRS